MAEALLATFRGLAQQIAEVLEQELARGDLQRGSLGDLGDLRAAAECGPWAGDLGEGSGALADAGLMLHEYAQKAQAGPSELLECPQVLAAAEGVLAGGGAGGLEGEGVRALAGQLAAALCAALAEARRRLAEAGRLLEEAGARPGRLVGDGGCLAACAAAAGRRAAAKLEALRGEASGHAAALEELADEFQRALAVVSAESGDVASSVDKLRATRLSCFEDLLSIDTAELSTVKGILDGVSLIKAALLGLTEKVTMLAKRMSEFASRAQGIVNSAFEAPKVLGCCLPSPSVTGSPLAKKLLDALDLSPVVSALEESSDHIHRVDRSVLMPAIEYAELVRDVVVEARAASEATRETGARLGVIATDLSLLGAALGEARRATGEAAREIERYVRGVAGLPEALRAAAAGVHDAGDLLDVDTAALQRCLEDGAAREGLRAVRGAREGLEGLGAHAGRLGGLADLGGRVSEALEPAAASYGRLRVLCLGPEAVEAPLPPALPAALAGALSRLPPPAAGASDGPLAARALEACDRLGGRGEEVLGAYAAYRGVATAELGKVVNLVASAKEAQGSLDAVASALKPGYKFGDVTRGLVAGGAQILARGKEARGADSGEGYRFGDLSRGVAAALGVGGAKTAPAPGGCGDGPAA